MYVPRFDEIQMHPGEMRLYRISAAEEGAAVAAEALPEIIVPEKFEYETDEPNNTRSSVYAHLRISDLRVMY